MVRSPVFIIHIWNRVVYIMAVAAVNRTVVYSETAIYDYKSLEVYYNKSILV